MYGSPNYPLRFKWMTCWKKHWQQWKMDVNMSTYTARSVAVVQLEFFLTHTPRFATAQSRQRYLICDFLLRTCHRLTCRLLQVLRVG